LLAGRDVLGQAQTGTGKTAAFGLPLLQRVDPARRGVQALVLTPTRELAIQVAEALHVYGRGLAGLTVLPVYGGQPIEPQQRKLARGVQVVVGTPGRVMDHLRRGALRLDEVRSVVLDEADEMLRMGFLEDVEWILSHAPAPAAGRQTALFSATMPAEIRTITRRHLADPVVVEVARRELAVPAIEQRYLVVTPPQKLEALTRLLETEPTDAVLVFTRTKLAAAELAERLAGRGYDADAIHGDMTQPLRERVLDRLRKGGLDLVVATDVAARGLDVERISHVVNYDIPTDVEAYVHRIGRTGRAGRAGVAVLFVTPRERRLLHEIERFTGQRIAPMRMPTPADVATRRKDLFKETLRRVAAGEELEAYLALVEELVEEGLDVAEIAAAAAWLAGRERPLQVALEPEPPASRFDARAGGAMVRLYLDAGRRAGVRPADIVGALANEGGVPGPRIGAIDVHDRFSLVDVPAELVESVLERMAGATLRGRPAGLREAVEAERALPRARPAHRPHAPNRPRAERLGAGRRPGAPAPGKPAKPRRFP
jgi:ATP-dependent RNA helicase DeaD